MRPFVSAIVLLVCALAAGCGKDASTTTPTTTTPASPTTTTISSRLTVNGAFSRTFIATTAGTVTATLTRAGGSGTRVGLGIGVPFGGVARCTLNQSITTTASASPQLSAKVDAGQYCVVVFDIGSLTDAIDFDLTVVFP